MDRTPPCDPDRWAGNEAGVAVAMPAPDLPDAAVAAAHPDSLPRIDAVEKVTGLARYPAEVWTEIAAAGPANVLLHAALVACPHPRARVLAVDAAQARALPGVERVFVPGDPALPELREGGDVLRLLHEPLVHFAGQPVALVLASSVERAREAAARVRVEYQTLPAVTAMHEALDTAYAPREAGRMPPDSRRGEPERALEAAEAVVDRRYETAANNHHPLEPHAVIAAWDGDDLLVHTCTQAVFATRRLLAHAFGLPREHVRVVSRYLGGGFGAKGTAWWPCLLLAIAAARAAGRPVKLELTRAQMFTLVGRRHETLQRLRLGATRDGRLTAIVHETVAQTSAYGDYADRVGGLSRSLYACPNVAVTHRLVRANAPQPCPMRAPGEGPGSFALESALDELADRLGIDPIELRVRNFTDRDPHLDRPWTSNGLLECYAVGAAAFGWQRRVAAPGSLCDGAELIGLGMASASYPFHRGPAEASVAIDGDDTVIVRCGTQDMGSGSYTALAQLAASTLGVPAARVRVALGDSELPEGPYSGGSMATASFAPAVEQAAAALRARLEAGERGELVEHARAAPEAAPTHSANAYGAVFAEVRVDRLLGTIRVTRLTAAYAAGRILNPLLARSQYVGGLIGGLGMALHETVATDARLGRIVNDNLCDYLVPVHADMPRFDVRFVHEDDALLGSTGVKGIGMLGTVGTAAAIANAVYNATGWRATRLPIRIEDFLSGMKR